MISILERIKRAYHFETDAELAEFLDMNPSTLSMQKNRGRLNLHRIIKKCENLNKNWLLDAEGEMWKNRDEAIRIPIFSSLEVDDNAPDLSNSKKAGYLVAEVNEELHELMFSDRVIGYVVSTESDAPRVQKNDIAIINLDSPADEESLFLVSNEKEFTFQQGPEAIEQPKSKVIGKLIWVMRRTG